MTVGAWGASCTVFGRSSVSWFPFLECWIGFCEVGGWWVLETYIGGCGNVSMRVQGSFVVGFTKMAFFDGFVDLESGWRLVGRLGLNLKVEWVAEIVCVQSK